MAVLQFNTKPLRDRVDMLRWRKWIPNLPSRDRFLSDFTLGLTDGLTVPFALTAGLSSLGDTNMVISAGVAELAAGSISMGIGGYLAERDTKSSAEDESSASASGEDYARLMADEELSDVEARISEKDTPVTANTAAKRYLAPLDLSPELSKMVLAHIMEKKNVLQELEDKEKEKEGSEAEEEQPVSPIVVGLTISLGYLVGGSLPLFPYFFVRHVGDGLKWSFGICVMALFLYGFTRGFLSNQDGSEKKANRQRLRRIRRSVWEGLIMAGLGMIAALAAVICVMLTPGLVGSS
jgi:vacuolar iron transporter family protein